MPRIWVSSLTDAQGRRSTIPAARASPIWTISVSSFGGARVEIDAGRLVGILFRLGLIGCGRLRLVLGPR